MVCCTLQSFDGKCLSFCGSFRPYAPLRPQELDRSWVRWKGHFKVSSGSLYWWSRIFNRFLFISKNSKKVYFHSRGGNYHLEILELSVRVCPVYLMYKFVCIIMINYSLIMTSLLLHSLAKRNQGEKRQKLIWYGFGMTNLDSWAFVFKICLLAYCFHSNTWCNLLSNLFELVSKELSVFCGFDWLYWCSKDLEIQKQQSTLLHKMNQSLRKFLFCMEVNYYVT